MIAAAAAIGAAFVAGKITQEAYNKWGKGLTDFLNDTGRWWGREIYDWLHPDPTTRNAFNNAQNWRPPRRDPLTLDLDGDGLETVEASAIKPILFDHDGDGIRNGSGWVKPDDGFLAMDRNGNGTIDNGSELFGDATALYAGGKAVDGFAALAQEDSNLDGKVDSADARWQRFRVWRDLNQDGLSQAGELFTLDQLGIASLSVAQTAHSQILPNGNQIADLGAFTWKNGGGGTMGDVGKMADINLVEDTFYRQYTDHVAIDQTVAALPEVRGSGAVRDLREAASLSPALRDILARYAQAGSRQEQRAVLGELMQAWADTSGLTASMQERAAGQYGVAYQAIGTQTPSSPGWDETVRAWEAKMHVLEAFNGRYFFGLPGQSGGASTAVTGLSVTQQAGATPQINIAVAPGQAALLEQSHDALRRSVYVALAMQTRFKPVLDQLGLTVDEAGVRLDFSRVEAHFREAIAQDAVNGLADLIDFNRGTREMFAGTGWNGEQAMARYMATLSLTSEMLEMYAQSGVQIVDNNLAYGSDGADLLLARDANSYVAANAGDDVLVGRVGNDRLEGGAGNDMLAGGGGADRLEGGTGNDTYLLGRGDGVDVISDYDTTPGNADVARFVDVASTDITSLECRGNDLVLRYGMLDALKVERYFDPAYTGFKVERFEFSDGMAWDEAMIKQKVVTVGSAGVDYISGYDDGPNRIYGLDGNDNLSGGVLNDLIDGGTGNDTLFGGKGNDQLYGAAGDDRIYGGKGNDILSGGTGNDWLGDEEGNDTYLFSRGDGIDVIADNDATPGNTDAVQFIDVASTELTALERRGNDLVLRYGVIDQVSVQAYFYPGYAGFKVEQFRFSDGVTWDEAAIKQRVMMPGSAADDNLAGYDDGSSRIYGFDGNDGLSGGAKDDYLDGGNGNDRLYGKAGNDVLRGGAGDDRLEGGAGNDIYLLARGDGMDMISDYDTTPGKVDVARFVDVASTEVTLLERRGYNLVLRYGSVDQLTVENHFHPSFPQYKVNQFEFSDGVVWDDAAIKARVRTVGTAFDDTVTGYDNGANRIYGLDGNDSLYGGNGDDLLCGGKGNDRLSGGAGSDTYVLARGDGMDVINNLDKTKGKIDVAQFVDVASTDVTTLERRGDNLLLRYGTPDQLTVEWYFDAYAPGYKLEKLQFSDGVTWDEAAVKQRVMTIGSPNGELIYGYNDGANRILGLGGNDNLYGGAWDDYIDGGIGDDKLNGGAGNDVLNGGVGNDLLSGDTGNDTYLLARGDGMDVINDYEGNADTVRFMDVASTEATLLERRGDHLVLRYGTPDQLTVERYFAQNYRNYKVERLEFSDGVVWIERAVKERVVTLGTASGDGIQGYDDGPNRIYGLDGNDYLSGGARDDLLDGGAGNDSLQGYAGNDILQGAAGADTLNDASGNNLLDGGADNDALNGGGGNELYIGGVGNDVISTGSGSDVIAFNRGDGQDVVLASSGQDNTVSLGSGIAAADLSLTKSGADLVLGTGANESITFGNWYASASNRSVGKLQMLDGVAGNEGDATSGPLENSRVAQFDFAALADRFDQARAATPGLTSWSLSSSLLDFHLGSSDSAAIGGDLAYQYARYGNLSGMSLAPSQSLLAGAQFGSGSQGFQSSAILQDLSPRLM